MKGVWWLSLRLSFGTSAYTCYVYSPQILLHCLLYRLQDVVSIRQDSHYACMVERFAIIHQLGRLNSIYAL